MDGLDWAAINPSCDGAQAYGSKGEAILAIEKRRKRRKRRGAKRRHGRDNAAPYRCRVCHQWHVGTP